MNVVLVGFMGCGKTAVGRRVARRLGYRLLDTDHFIESELGIPISEVFARHGEPYFRRLETVLLQRLVGLNHLVVATGGGIVTTPGNMALLKQVGPVIFLDADPEDIIERLQRDTRRPLVQGGDLRDKVARLLGERRPLYEQADIVIPTRGKSPNQVAGEAIRRAATFRRAPDGETGGATAAE